MSGLTQAKVEADQGSELLAKAGVSACLPMMRRLGTTVLNPGARYGALTSVSKADPNKHMASALYGQQLLGDQGEAAVAAVFGAPTADGKCDGAALYIVPSARSCIDLQRPILANKGEMTANLANIIPVLGGVPNTDQVLLVPSPANGCVVITMQSVGTP